MACAMWLTSNGAWIRWKGENQFITDSKLLVPHNELLSQISSDTEDDKAAKKTNWLPRRRRQLTRKVNVATRKVDIPKDTADLIVPPPERILEEVYAEQATLYQNGFWHFGNYIFFVMCCGCITVCKCCY